MKCNVLIGKGLKNESLIGKSITGKIIGFDEKITVGEIVEYDEKTGIGSVELNESEFSKIDYKPVSGQNIGILSREIV